MEKGLCFHTVIVLFVFMTHRAESQVTVQLVSARDRIEGSMLGPQAVYADADRIYLASFQGKLFVLARDRSADFPLLEVVQDTIFPLTAVRGDQCNLYVSSARHASGISQRAPTRAYCRDFTLNAIPGKRD